LFAIVACLTLADFAHASIGTRQQDVPSSRLYGDDISLDQLHAAATSDHIVTRIDALQRIATDANPASLQVLEQALQDGEPTIREIATVGLARLGEPSSIPALVGAMHDENAAVRTRAAVAITGIEPSEAVVSDFLTVLDEQQSKTPGRKGHRGKLQATSQTEEGHRASGQSSLVISKKVLRGMVMSRPATTGLLIDELTGMSPARRYATAYALSTSADPEVVAAFENALARQDTAVVSGAYEYYLSKQLGRAKSALLRGLDEFDDADLILALSQCGDGDLEAAAAQVARKKGVRIGN